MQPRVKIFTHVSNEGSMILASEVEDHINEWLAQADGKLLNVTQSESHRPNGAQHITIAIWYEPSK